MRSWGRFLRREQQEADLNKELRFHIEERIADFRRSGLSEEEARRKVRQEFGGMEQVKDDCRDARWTRWLEDLWQDLRHAVRMLRKQPGFAAASIVTLALGIGANTAMFSLINAALLRALPFRDSHRLVVIWAENGGRMGLPLVPPANADIAAWRDHTESFDKIAAFSPRTVDIAERDDPERVGAAAVTSGFFETLGIIPVLGRTMAPIEETRGGLPVALISYGLWQRRFGGDPALVGNDISIDGATRTVIGILPADFDFPRGAEWPAYFPFAGRTDVWLPLAYRARNDGTGASNWESRDERGLAVIGRIKHGTSLRQAQAEMDTFAARQAHDHPDTHGDTRLKLVPLRDQLAGQFNRSLLILSAAAGLLLLIACVNVANLLLARGVARQQEVAVCAALGAGRGRLIRKLLTESLLLAVLASGIGLLIATRCLKVFLVLNPITHSRLDEATLDLPALGFAAFIALVTTAVFGLVPAVHASRFDLRQSLHEGGRGGDGALRQRVRAWLVAAEVALALVLLTTAGLMVRSLLRVEAVDPGFRSDSVLVFDLQLPGARYPTEVTQVMFFRQLLAHLEGLPAVRAAGAISYLPLSGGENMGDFAIEGEPPVRPGHEPKGERRSVTPAYFAAMGIPIRRGRMFTPRDTTDQPRVVVINETLAQQFFSFGDPLGRRIRVGGSWRTVVGVVADVKSSSLESRVRPQLYVPYAQWPWTGMTVVVNTHGAPLALTSAIRSEVKRIDELVPVANIRTMQQVVSKAASFRRFNMALLASFAVTALFLTVIGIYGVVAFLASRRSREIGIRIALGARRADILWLVLQDAMKPIAVGAIGGLAGSLATSRLVASQLYGVSSADPLTLTSTIAVLLTASLLACWLPARRATKVHPVEVLRCD